MAYRIEVSLCRRGGLVRAGDSCAQIGIPRGDRL